MTRFANPHGLQDKANHSTAYELAQLSVHALKNPLVCEIVNCKTHTATSTYFPTRRFFKLYPQLEVPPPIVGGTDLPFEPKIKSQFVLYPMTWHNSNRMLTVKGFSGIKTGITQTAGSCLSVSYESEGCKLVTVVLGCKSVEHRWKDTRRLTLWA